MPGGGLPEAIRVISSPEDQDTLEVPDRGRLAYFIQAILNTDDTAAIVERFKKRFRELSVRRAG